VSGVMPSEDRNSEVGNIIAQMLESAPILCVTSESKIAISCQHVFHRVLSFVSTMGLEAREGVPERLNRSGWEIRIDNYGSYFCRRSLTF
jgi:hypothetical protein